MCGIPSPHATMRNVTKYGPCNPVNITAISNIILASLFLERWTFLDVWKKQVVSVKKVDNKTCMKCRLSTVKALNGIQWEVAHPLSLNFGAPITSIDATMCVRGVSTPYVGITKGICYTYVGSAFTADTHGCIYRSDRGSKI